MKIYQTLDSDHWEVVIDGGMEARHMITFEVFNSFRDKMYVLISRTVNTVGGGFGV